MLCIRNLVWRVTSLIVSGFSELFGSASGYGRLARTARTQLLEASDVDIDFKCAPRGFWKRETTQDMLLYAKSEKTVELWVVSKKRNNANLELLSTEVGVKMLEGAEREKRSANFVK
jgi:hypothetical protein